MRERQRRGMLEQKERLPQNAKCVLNISMYQTGTSKDTVPMPPLPDFHSFSGPAVGSSSRNIELLFNSIMRAAAEKDFNDMESVYALLESLQKSSDMPRDFIPIDVRMQKNFKALDVYEQTAKDSSIDIVNGVGILKTGAMKEEFGTDVAESACVSILLGDETYRLNVGRYVFSDLGQILGLPNLGLQLPELDDDDEWDDYCCPSDNGRLAQAVVKDTDIALYDILSNVRHKESDGVGKHDYEDTHRKFIIPIKLSAAIAQLAGRPLGDELYLRKSHIKAFRELGYSERKARDFAIVAATLRSVKEEDELDRHRYFYEHVEEAVREDETLEVSDELKAAIEEKQIAEQLQKSAERESQTLRHEIADMHRKQADLMKRMKLMEEEIRKRDELIGLYEKSMDNEEGEYPADGQGEEESIFPFHTDLRVVLYGGFHVFHQEIMKMLPDVRIVPCTSHVDMAVFRNADIIFLQINKTNHSNYWSVIDIAKNMEIPFFHLNYASAKRCAVEMAKEIQRCTAS